MAKTAAAIQSSAISPPAIVDAATGISRHAASKPSYLFQSLITPSKRGDPRYTFECLVFKAHNDPGIGDKNIICSERRRRKGSCNDDDSKKVDQDSTNGIKKGKSDDDILASATLAIEPKFIHQCGSVGHVINIYIREGGGRGGGGGTVSVKEQRLQAIQSLLDCVHEKARSLGCYKCLIDANESLAKELKDLGTYKIKGVQMCIELLQLSSQGEKKPRKHSSKRDKKASIPPSSSSDVTASSTSVLAPVVAPTIGAGVLTTMIKIKGRRGEDIDEAEEDEKQKTVAVMMKTKPIFSCHRITSDDFNKGFLELLAQLTVVGVISSKLFQDQLKAIDSHTGQYSLVVRHPQIGRIVATATLLVLKHKRRRRRRSRQGSSAATTSSDLKTKEAAEQKDGDDNNNYGDKKRKSYQENDNNEDYNEDDDIDQEEIINVGHIEDVVVDRQIRGQGLGKFILSSILSLALDKNCECCILNCDRKNIPFYKKCGFEEKLIGMAHYF